MIDDGNPIPVHLLGSCENVLSQSEFRPDLSMCEIEPRQCLLAFRADLNARYPPNESMPNLGTFCEHRKKFDR